MNNPGAMIRWELVPYFYGRVLDIGCGALKTFPHFIGVDEGDWPAHKAPDVVLKSMWKLDVFASKSIDTVFSACKLQVVETAQIPAIIAELARVLKVGGHLILYLPREDKERKWSVDYTTVIQFMAALPGWDLVDYQERKTDGENHLFFVFKVGGREKAYSWKAEKPKKTAAVVRYGAIGDMIQTSSLFPALKEQGYHVTLYCQEGPGFEAVRCDPCVDRFLLQKRDGVPPHFIGEFVAYTAKKYDLFVNLCESVEGTLLALPGRANHEWPDAIRSRYMDRNYLEWTHELAGMPPPYRPQFYATTQEKAWANQQRARWGKTILWSLSGSSIHKTWPHLDETINRVLEHYPDVHVVLVGDDFCRLLETGWDKGESKRVHCRSAVWSIRESMVFAQMCDLLIGTETGLLNAAGMMDTPKIVTMSHSSENMLTKHWKNAIVLRQPEGTGCPKQPCRQLHYTWDHCMKHEETGTAMCQWAITADMMFDAIKRALGEPARKVA